MIGLTYRAFLTTAWSSHVQKHITSYRALQISGLNLFLGMGSQERLKKKAHLWKRAIVHFLLCFVMGFFTGFAPTGKPSIFSSHVTMLQSESAESVQPVEVFPHPETENFNQSLLDKSEPSAGRGPYAERAVTLDEDDTENKQKQRLEDAALRRQVIVITPTSAKNKLRKVLLWRLASTLKLVAPPLLWIVVEQKSHDPEISEILRRTGIMYRHIVFKENFTDINSEMDHQRNLALNHIEHHKLSGIVLFAGISSVYDFSFFEEIRSIQ